MTGGRRGRAVGPSPNRPIVRNPMESKCWCGADIDPDRAELGFTTCVHHGHQKPHIGFMVYGHKTAGDIQIIPDNSRTQESLRLARRANARSR